MNKTIRRCLRNLAAGSMAMITAASPLMQPLMPVVVLAAEEEPETALEHYSFEEEMNEQELALYKAQRSDERAHDGSWSIKVASERPGNTADVPRWQYNQSKGSMHITVDHCLPNTTYTITMYIWNETGGRLNAGLVVVEGETNLPWNPGFVGGGRYDGISGASSDWQKVTRTITTGPRSDRFYIYAYCMNRKDGTDSGAFYVDDISVVQKDTSQSEQQATIGYHESEQRAFPDVIPVIQSFEPHEEGFFKLHKDFQTICADSASMDKARYLGECLVSKGVIDFYQLREIGSDEEGEGIVLKQQGSWVGQRSTGQSCCQTGRTRYGQRCFAECDGSARAAAGGLHGCGRSHRQSAPAA